MDLLVLIIPTLNRTQVQKQQFWNAALQKKLLETILKNGIPGMEWKLDVNVRHGGQTSRAKEPKFKVKFQLLVIWWEDRDQTGAGKRPRTCGSSSSPDINGRRVRFSTDLARGPPPGGAETAPFNNSKMLKF